MAKCPVIIDTEIKHVDLKKHNDYCVVSFLVVFLSIGARIFSLKVDKTLTREQSNDEAWGKF